MGIPVQGIIHDLSKYSLTELSICKYYSGTKSPHQNCRDTIGYSPSWNHHYHRNKHHFEYWWDETSSGEIIQVKMPYKYVIEAFCDTIGAGKTYLGDKWTQNSPLQYYENNSKEKNCLNEESKQLYLLLLTNLSKYGEQGFIKWYRHNKKALQKSYQKGLTK